MTNDEPGITPVNDGPGNAAYRAMKDALSAVTQAEKEGRPF